MHINPLYIIWGVELKVDNQKKGEPQTILNLNNQNKSKIFAQDNRSLF